MDKQGNLQALLLEFYEGELRYYKGSCNKDRKRLKRVKDAQEALERLRQDNSEDKVLCEIKENLDKIAEAAAGNLEHSRNMKARYAKILNLAQQ